MVNVVNKMSCFCGSTIQIREHIDIDGDRYYSYICNDKNCVLHNYQFDTKNEAESSVRKLLDMISTTKFERRYIKNSINNERSLAVHNEWKDGLL